MHKRRHKNNKSREAEVNADSVILEKSKGKKEIVDDNKVLPAINGSLD